MALLLIFALGSCKPQRTKMFSPSVVSFQVSYSPILDNCLYPSLILGLSHSTILEDSISLFTCGVTAPRDNAVLRIVIDSSSLNYTTIIQEVLPKKGERYVFHPSLKWKYDNLYATRKQGSVDLTFVCYINDEEVDIRNLKLNYRSVNECLLSTRKNGRTYDFRWLFAGFVNEDHVIIDQILSQILDDGSVKNFVGYQGGTKTVTEQVKAIWRYVLEHGITYSSISCTSNPSPSTNVQHIRFFDEVYQNRQANCIDACVFFASIMRKIGLKPVIFVEPCHAYLGYYTDKNRKNIALLETTITGWVHMPADNPSQSDLEKLARYLSPKNRELCLSGKMEYSEVTRLVADSLFIRASDYCKEDYAQNRALFEDSSNITYQKLDIEELRRYVQPVN